MSGWGTLTGESNYTLSSLVHTFDADKKLGAFNIRGYSNPALDKLIEAAGVEMDTAKREQQLKDANALVAKDRPNLAIASVISAWGLKKGLTIVPRSDEDTLAMNIRPAK
jgi:peptide/nickel transport system substrate-binding protein